MTAILCAQVHCHGSSSTDYRPQTKLREGNVLHLSVSHSVHREGVGFQHAPRCGRGLFKHAPEERVYITVYTWGECVDGGVNRGYRQGVHVDGGTHPCHTPVTATAADGTHPTGMNSCYDLIVLVKYNIVVRFFNYILHIIHLLRKTWQVHLCL